MKIYFYDNEVREFCLSNPKYRELLERIATGTCLKADNKESLSGTNGLHSVRTNDKWRLLFIYIKDTINDNKTAVLMWRHIPHNYSPIIKAFKNSKNLSNFKPIEEPISKHEEIEKSDEIKEKADFSETFGEFKESSGLNNYFILDNLQQEAVYKPLPVILEGGPGSGKTTVLLSVLEQQLPFLAESLEAFKQTGLPPKKILCITKSKFLINAIKEEWALSPLFEAYKDLVEIITYDAFLEEILEKNNIPLNYLSKKFKPWFDERLKNKDEKSIYMNYKLKQIHDDCDGDEELELKLAYEELREEFQAHVFSTWFQDRFSKTGNKKKKGRKPTFSIEDSKLVYEEFRIASGYKDQASYVKSGDKQSSLDVNQRDALYEHYKQWIIHQNDNQLKFSDFFDLTPYLKDILNQYLKLLIDEGQDFSHLQLKLLVQFILNGQFIVCVDQRQNLFDSNPKSIFLKDIINALFRTKDPIEPLVLPNAYRCPGQVMRFGVKVFNELRRQFSPVTKQEAPIEIPQNNEGRVLLLDPNHLSEEEKHEFEFLQEKTKSIDTCIVVTDKDKFADAKKLFPNCILIATAERVKGLAFKRIILFNILNNELIYEINQLIINGELKDLPKNAKFCTILSEIFVAITRAELEVYMVQENMVDNHNLSNFKKLILSVINANKNCFSELESEKISPSTLEELKEKAIHLYKEGSTDLAFGILIENGHMSIEEAGSFLQESTKEDVTQTKENALRAIKKGDLSKIKQIFSRINSFLFDEKDSIEILNAIISATRNRLEIFKVVLNSKKITLNAATSLIAFPIIEGCHSVKQTVTGGADKPSARQEELLNLLRVLVAHEEFVINDTRSFVRNDTPLCWAIYGNHLSAVKVLLESKKINLNLQDLNNFNYTPLLYGVAYCVDFRIIQTLINDSRTDITLADDNGNTLLHMLTTDEVYTNKIREALFKAKSPDKIPVNMANKESKTPFSLAIENRNFNLVIYLLQKYKVDLNMVNNIDELLDSAAELLTPENTSHLYDLLSLADKASKKINWNYQNKKSKRTALMGACAFNGVSGARTFYQLIDSGVNVTCFDARGYSALAYAVFAQNVTVVKYFLLNKRELFKVEALTQNPENIKVMRKGFEFFLNNEKFNDKEKRFLKEVMKALFGEAQPETRVNMVYKNDLFAAIESGDFSKLEKELSDPRLVLDETESFSLLEKILASANKKKMFLVAFNSKKIVMSPKSSQIVFLLIYKLKEVSYGSACELIDILNIFINYDGFEINVKDVNFDTPLNLAVIMLSTIRKNAGNALSLKRQETPISLLSSAIKLLLSSEKINPYLGDIEKLLHVMGDENIPIEIVLEILNHKNTDLTQIFLEEGGSNLILGISFRKKPRHILVLEKLLELNPAKKLSVNHASSNGAVALNFAILHCVNSGGNNIAMIRYLLKHPEIDLGSVKGQNDISRLLDCIYDKMTQKAAIEIIDLLARADRNNTINWNHQSPKKKVTALILTCKDKTELSLTYFSRLIEVYNVDVSLFDSNGYSALFYAILYENMIVFRYFFLNKKEFLKTNALTCHPEKIKTIKKSYDRLSAKVLGTAEAIIKWRENNANLFLTDNKDEMDSAAQKPTAQMPLTFSLEASTNVPPRADSPKPKSTPMAEEFLDMEGVQELIKTLDWVSKLDGFDFNQKDPKGDPPLSIAVSTLSNLRKIVAENGLNHLETPIPQLSSTIKTMLSSERINPYQGDIEKLLHIMEDENVPLEIVLEILNHKNTDLTQTFINRLSNNLLHEISFRNIPRQIKILEKLFEINPSKKLPINHANEAGTVPLNVAIAHCVATAGSNIAMIRYLLKHPDIDLSLVKGPNDINKLLDYIYNKTPQKTAIEMIDLLARADRNSTINWKHQSPKQFDEILKDEMDSAAQKPLTFSPEASAIVPQTGDSPEPKKPKGKLTHPPAPKRKEYKKLEDLENKLKATPKANAFPN